MAAQGLPAGDPLAAPSGWELEAWYQDLQEVLAAAESSGSPPPWGLEQAELSGTEGAGGSPEGCGLDAALAAELLELLGPERRASPEPAPPGAASEHSSPPQEEAATARRRVKRKRCDESGERAKRRERANEQRVLELTAHNEQLRAEIQRLSTEVQHTRAALIDRIVNLRRA